MDPVVIETVIKISRPHAAACRHPSVLEPNIFASALLKIMGTGAVLLSNRVTLLPAISSERFYKNCVVRILARQQHIKTPPNIQTYITPSPPFFS